jgi:spermidine synthase
VLSEASVIPNNSGWPSVACASLRRMKPSAARVAALLLLSGACALTYQIGWEREFRLVFGGSTAASGAVLAIFIGGLGIGGLVLGRRADAHTNPLRLYAVLEILIATTAAASPLLLTVVRQIYVGLGGTSRLGPVAGTLVRLLLAGLVLGVPTFLMGGTLPAAARSVETSEDTRRRRVALLYGVNTLGAVIGCLASNFFMLEVFGTRSTLWRAAGLNLLVGLWAASLSRATSAPAETEVSGEPALEDAPPAPFILAAAGVVGFAFFLMELVWYRMLGPLLGGTIFTFGLILAVALLGIGLGGAAYALREARRPATLEGFAATCLAEAVVVLFPFALGDRLAFVALQLRSLGALGFAGEVAGWGVVAAIVVFPAAFVSGVQFPLLIALLGRGRLRVGRQIGLTYACNTAGAILGALAGGFGLLPLLSAPGCWRLAAFTLLALGLAAAGLALRRGAARRRLALPATLAIAVAAMSTASGPTAVWRHNGLAASREMLPFDRNGQIERERMCRQAVVWEADGVEASVALTAAYPSALAFMINGKIDGNARTDAPTQVMLGLLGLLLHPGNPRRAMVVGLGTGSTAGWMGAVPGVERVDVVELEPVILDVARAVTPVNHDALTNPRVHVQIGDAREVLLTTPSRYDVVVSEPSNPYRAGVASLFTREYYRAISERLEADGIFVQWLQAYSVDAKTVRSVYATLASVFPRIETWQTHSVDLLLVASKQPLRPDADDLRARVAQEPYRSGLLGAWRAIDLEGVLAHFLAGPSLADAVAARESAINTDDQNLVEFSFARTLGGGTFRPEEVRTLALALGDGRPQLRGAPPDWARVEDERALSQTASSTLPTLDPALRPEQRQRVMAQRAWLSGDPAGALAAWTAQGRPPVNPVEIALVAECLAERGDEGAVALAERLQAYQPVEALAILARLRLRQGRPDEAAATFHSALEGYRTDPWPLPRIMVGALALAPEIARQKPVLAPGLLDALATPFSIHSLDARRKATALEISATLGDLGPGCLRVVEPLEPDFPWLGPPLLYRRDCYAAQRHPAASRADAELREFLRNEPLAFSAGVAR